MNKIFLYELRRMLVSKYYLIFIAVCLGFGYFTLTSVTILGGSRCAPFAPESFADYLLRILPLLLAAMLLFLYNLFGGKARKIKCVTDATGVNEGKYIAVRCGAAATAFTVLGLISAGLGLGFLLILFKSSVPIVSLLLTTAAVILPLPLLLLIAAAVMPKFFRKR